MSASSSATLLPFVRFAARNTLPRIGAILLAWLVLLAIEHVVVGFGYRTLFVGTWEMGAARNFVSPIALAMLLPGAVLGYLFAELARNSVIDRAARVACGVFAALGAAALAIGVSGGRHMASLAVRAPFVAVLALAGGAAAYAMAPRFVAFAARAPRAFAAVGAAAAAMFWAADAFVLPRLYPAFHLGLFVLMLASAAFMACLVWDRRRIGGSVLALAVACALATPWAAGRLSNVDNLRVVLLDHAPLMGRAVLLGAAIAPPADDLEGADGAGNPASQTNQDRVTSAKLVPGEVPRALDWTGRDIVLISVDALRADHVGAYGYDRPTTPNIDRLAAEGTLFESAYCPTPHTSYSITSMMTGKYMRPLLLVGLGEDSETWAKVMRQYGHLTAAFYPPAVFFIDASRFTTFEKSGLDFEYRRVEFSSADERAEQVGRYLERSVPPSRRLFLWVHLFEPHEPYVMHPEHPFGAPDAPTDRDRYDSEVAAADAGIGKILARVREKRPNAVVMLTADHGEEFGEHGGRYHGTTVYDEQVRVPLIIAGSGTPKRVSSVVQTIDLLPTTLSALGIPRPARLRGRDLGPLVAPDPKKAPPPETEKGLAFVETDHFTLLARGQDRLVCARKAGACTLFDAKSDPREEHDVGAAHADTVKELRQLTAAIAREHGRLERGEAQAWPEALRRGSQGDVEAAPDVAMLLDDVRLDVRRKAAEVLFDLHAPGTAPALQRALATAEDAQVRAGCALALVRLGEPPSRAAEDSLKSPLEWKRRAALAFAERGDARGLPELLAWWNESHGEREMNLDFERAKEILAALAKLRDRSAVPPLVRALGDVRLRPFIADTLGAIGDPSARPPLLSALATERYVPTRPHLARALLALGAREELRAPLARFAGLPEPMPEALNVALEAKILDEAHGGWAAKGDAGPNPSVTTALVVPRQKRPTPLRLLVLLEKEGDKVEGTVESRPVSAVAGEGALRVVELGPDVLDLPRIQVQLASPGGIRALWLLPHTEEIEPPPPEPWDAGSVDPADSGQ